jgi:hypothetical protein
VENSLFHQPKLTQAVIFSRLSTPNFWLITSTIPISSINPATILFFGQDV